MLFTNRIPADAAFRQLCQGGVFLVCVATLAPQKSRGELPAALARLRTSRDGARHTFLHRSAVGPEKTPPRRPRGQGELLLNNATRGT